MAFAQIRLFKITGFEDGKPSLDTTPLQFLKQDVNEQEINNISVSLQADAVTKTYTADDIQEQDTIIKGYSGTFTFYGIDADALDLISSFRKDKNGNTILGANDGTEKNVCIFYRGKNEKGKKYNCWLYDVEFKPLNLDVGQDEDSPKSISIEFYAKLLTINGKKVLGSMVYENNTGYIAEGTEPKSTDIYYEAEEE